MRYEDQHAEVLRVILIPSSSDTTAVLYSHSYFLIAQTLHPHSSLNNTQLHAEVRPPTSTRATRREIASHTVPTPTSTHRQHPLRQLILHTTSPFRFSTSLGPLRSTSYTPSAPLDPVFTIFGSQQLCLGRRKLTDSGGCLV